MQLDMMTASLISTAGKQLWSRLRAASIILTLCALVVPVVLVGIPTFVDYPNHLARIWLISGGITAPSISSMYQLDWNTQTNIGIDVLSLALTKMLAYRLVGSIMVALSIGLPPLGGVLLWRAIHGRWHWWQVSFTLFAWGMGVTMGFLNFEIGLGFALLAAALDCWLARHGLIMQMGVRMVASAILLAIHVIAVPFFLLLLCAMRVGPSFRDCFSEPFKKITRLVSISLTVSLPLVLSMAFSNKAGVIQPEESLINTTLQIWHKLATIITNHQMKLFNLTAIFGAYSSRIDMITSLVVALPILTSLLLGRLFLHAGILIGASVLLLLYILCPFILNATAFVDVRFSLMLPFLVALGLRPNLPLPKAAIVGTVMTVASLLRTASVGWTLHERQADVRSVFRALQPVPAGAAILPLQHVYSGPNAPAGRYTTIGVAGFGHLATLAIPWRHAFVPTLFAFRGKQPVEVMPPWNDVIEPNGGEIKSVHALDHADENAPPIYNASYIRCWRSRFNFALVLNADLPDDGGPFALPPNMTLMRDEGFAQLYSIKQDNQLDATAATRCKSEPSRYETDR